MTSSTAASTATPRPASWRPWTQAWIEGAGVAPVWVGLALAAAHVAVGVLFHVALSLGTVGAVMPPDALGGALVYGLLVGYGPAALAYARRRNAATLAELRPVLGAGQELDAAFREVMRYRPFLLRGVGVAAVLASAWVTLFTTGLAEDLGMGNPRLVWIVWQNVLAFWLVSRTIAHDLAVSWRMARLTEERARVDPLDAAPLRPLARKGLQGALLLVIATSIFSLVYGLDHVSPAVPLLQALTVGMAAFAMLLPSVGVHRRLKRAKAEELARLAGEIRALRADPDDAGRLASLLTLRGHVAGAREWPFDLGTLGRFALYSAIGVGSWLGGALVERLLDLALG